MSTTFSLDDLKRYQDEATRFFASELMLLKEVMPKIADKRLTKAAVLLMSSGQTGTALLLLANQIDAFTSETLMLARSFMEQITNFCYVGVCDEKEYRAFILHPVYKHYHNIGSPAVGTFLNQDRDGSQKIRVLIKTVYISSNPTLSIFSLT